MGSTKRTRSYNPRLIQADAEKSVLGAFFNDAPVALLQTLSTKDFTVSAHLELFDAMRRVAEEGKPIDLITVDAELTRAGVLAKVGGSTFLVETSQWVPTAANIEAYIRIIRDASLRREILDTLRNYAVSLTDLDTDVVEIIGGVRESLSRMSVAGGETVSIQKLVDDYLYGLGGKETAQPIKTGLPWLDRNVRMMPGTMTTIGARTNVGKSILMQQIGINAARHGHKVLWVSAEMTMEDIQQRAVSYLSGIHIAKIIEQNITPEEMTRLGAAHEEIRGWTMESIFDAHTIAQVDKSVRAEMQKCHYDLIVVDYLQFIAGNSGRGRSREQDVAEAVKKVRLLALDFNTAVLTAAQLNRTMESGPTKPRRPRVSDMRESGAIEQDSNIILLLCEIDEGLTLNAFQDNLLREVKASGRTLVEINIGKNRQGPKNISTNFAFNGGMMRYEDLYTAGQMREITGPTPFDEA